MTIGKWLLPPGVEENREIVQVVFSLREWAPGQARAWAAMRGYRIDQMRVTEYSVILRQFDQNEAVGRTLRNEATGTLGVHLVTGCRRERFAELQLQPRESWTAMAK